MDSSIQIGPWSIGLDPLLGLLPGLGDLLGAAISLLIVMRAIAAGVPRVAVARMMTNLAVDTLVGAIPVVGDVFDFAYKANMKNLRIYEETLYQGHRATRRHWLFFALLFAAGLVAIGLMLFGLYALIRRWGAI
jgi:hypothetical protein